MAAKLLFQPRMTELLKEEQQYSYFHFYYDFHFTYKIYKMFKGGKMNHGREGERWEGGRKV